MVICLERGADLHMAQLMPLPPTVSCSSKIQIGFTFLVPAHLGSPGQRAVKQMYDVPIQEASSGNWHINFSFTAKCTLCRKVAKISVNGRQRKSVNK